MSADYIAVSHGRRLLENFAGLTAGGHMIEYFASRLSRSFLAGEKLSRLASSCLLPSILSLRRAEAI